VNHKFLTSLLVFMMAFVAVFTATSTTYAQSTKPKLARVTLDKKTNNQDALKIAERLNPDFFITEDGFEPGDFFASYLNLDPKDPKRFLVVTAQNTSYYCTSYGCPYYIYKSSGKNVWSLALSLQANGVYYDLNSPNSKPRNIISASIDQAKKSVKIWLWNGLNYVEAKR
jgi:hypothetical protein